MEIRQSTRPVLLVEDDEAIRESLTELLECEGYRVVTARNGRQAIDWLEASSDLPAVVLLDLMMPSMSGFDLLEAMRALSSAERRDLPVIVLTASRERPADPAVIACLRKPFDVDELLAAIARAFSAS